MSESIASQAASASWRGARITRAILALSALTVSAGTLKAKPEARPQQAPQSPKLERYQPKSIPEPKAGSIAGTLHAFDIGKSQLAYGSASVPLAIDVDQAMGPLLVSIFPSYSPDSAQSVWGSGFREPGVIHRINVSQELQFDETDDLATPWGRFVKGDDGAFYSHGLKSRIRITIDEGLNLTAYLPSGTTVTFKPLLMGKKGKGYKWFVDQAQTKTGLTNHFYWTRSDQSALVLSHVLYGGRSADTSFYRIDFSYKAIGEAQQLTSWASGSPVVADKILTQVAFASRIYQSSDFNPRWHYDLNHERPPLHKASHYLTRIQKIFASGAKEPAATFRYDWLEDHLNKAEYKVSAPLSEISENIGSAGLIPNKMSVFDFDRNGYSDFESSINGKVYLQQPDGTFTVHEHEIKKGPADCHPYFGSTVNGRSIGRVNGRDSGLVNFTMFGDEINVCDVEGGLIQKIDTNVPSVNFHKSALVDINRDGKVDILAYHMLFYDIAYNVSEGEEAKFRYKSIELEEARTTRVAWFLDINGDGHIDILGANQLGIEVFHGKGNFEFEPKSVTIPVRDIELLDLNKYGTYFSDVNKDGLVDLYATRGPYIELFLNTGNGFEAIGLQNRVANPDADKDKNLVVADLGGSESSNLVIWNANKIKTLAVNRASTGLMVSADDGKGSRLSFSYRLTPPDAKSGRETIVVAEVKKTVVGKGQDSIRYGYQSPYYLGKNGRFSGFKAVTAQHGEQSDRHSFTSDAVALATLLSTARTDKLGITRSQTTRYKFLSLQGVGTYLPEVTEETTSKGGQQMTKTHTVASWNAMLCPTKQTSRDAWGALEHSLVYARPAGLEGHLTCLPSSHTYRSSDSDFPLEWQDILTYNTKGQVLTKARKSGGDSVTFYEKTYDDLGRVQAATTPDQGTWRYGYYSYSQLLTDVTDNLGVVTKSSGLHPQTGRIKERSIQRGANHSFAQRYNYDPFERLKSVTDSMAKGPIAEYSYLYPSGNALGYVSTRSFTTASAVAESLAVATGDGQTVTNLRKSRQAWQPSTIVKSEYGTDRSEAWRSQPFDDLQTALNPATLYSNANRVSTQLTTKSGQTLADYTMIAAGIQKNTELSYGISAGAAVTKQVINGQVTTSLQKDASGRTISFSDALGNLYRYRYDAAGRLRTAYLPSGAQQDYSFDGIGRLASVTRPSIGTLYSRYNGKNQVQQQELWDSKGSKALVKRFSYDSAGRISKVVYSDKENPEISYSYSYDGKDGLGNTTSKQLGLLTAVHGPNFRKTFSYDDAGRKTKVHIRFFNGHNLEKQTSYYQNSAVKATLTRLVSNDGKILDQIERSFAYSAEGRLASVTVNGKQNFGITYDALGRVAALEGGELSYRPSYEALTHTYNGFLYKSSDGFLGYSVTKDRRGLISGEGLSKNTGEQAKAFSYDLRGHLVSSGPHSYAYDSDARIASALAVTQDSFGRLATLPGRSYRYGADGQLQTASTGDQVTEYYYDENQQLIASNGPQGFRFFYEGTRIHGETLVEDVEIAGFYLGYVKAGVFTPVFADPRGTPVAPDYSPFGLRAEYSEQSEIIDFTRFGRDSVSGLVRMGVRHFSPELGRFTTPDILFLQNPTLCLENPVGCNLYSYGRNDPLSFTDPTGLCARGGCGTGQYLRYTVRPLEKAYNRLAKAMGTAATGVSKVFDSIDFVGGGATASVKYPNSSDTLVSSMGTKLGWNSKGPTIMMNFSKFVGSPFQKVGVSESIGVKKGVAHDAFQSKARIGPSALYAEFDLNSQNSKHELSSSSLVGFGLKIDPIFAQIGIDRSSKTATISGGYGKSKYLDAGVFLEFELTDQRAFDSGLNELEHSQTQFPSGNQLWKDDSYLE